MGSRRVISLVLSFLLTFLCLTVGVTVTAFAETNDVEITNQYDISADRLYVYGLFKGGEEGYNLESESDRVQAAVMLVRLLGAEEQVLKNTYYHPYTDVPKWASNYVGYLYQNEIILTTEKDKFGPDEKISATDYTVGVLSALGYHKVDAGDREKAVYRAAKNAGLLTAEEVSLISETEFNRGTMVYISEKALNTKIKGAQVTLYEKLDKAGIIKNLPEPTDEIRYGKTAVKLANAKKAAANIITKAKENVGVRYRSGGRSPATGFDCSGYVGYTLVQSGVWDRYY
ncbi:MAG: S-layer homology domain-containing protein, partial [Firmicutes bacterium]|nr:S-layer homology domain-containing protein [Bacillota bacterium]